MIRRLRLILFLALMLAPLGRIGMAEASPAPATAASEHCAGTPAHGEERPADEGMAIDCMTACAALAAIPAPCATPSPPAPAHATPAPLLQVPLGGLLPDAELPPPRLS
jgi:hypothetical protein